MAEIALPPFDLRERVGATTSAAAAQERRLRKASWWDADPEVAWLRQGQHIAGLLREHLPAGVSLSGAKVLDFGCGAGRVLRHLVDEVGDGELHGVDIDRQSIEWLQRHASPPIRAVCVEEQPGLPYPDRSFDVVYAFSVFTHLVEHWAGWLLELRRVLAPGGVLLASLIGRETSKELGLSVPGDTPGMYVFGLGNPWEVGGPVTVHDPAWIAERWGRAFEIVAHAPRATGTPWPHDLVAARPKGGTLTEDDLLVPGADGASEGRAQRIQLELLRKYALARHTDHEAHGRELAGATAAAREQVERRVEGRIAELTRRWAELEQPARAAAPVKRGAGSRSRRWTGRHADAR